MEFSLLGEKGEKRKKSDCGTCLYICIDVCTYVYTYNSVHQGEYHVLGSLKVQHFCKHFILHPIYILCTYYCYNMCNGEQTCTGFNPLVVRISTLSPSLPGPAHIRQIVDSTNNLNTSIMWNSCRLHCISVSPCQSIQDISIWCNAQSWSTATVWTSGHRTLSTLHKGDKGIQIIYQCVRKVYIHKPA